MTNAIDPNDVKKKATEEEKETMALLFVLRAILDKRLATLKDRIDATKGGYRQYKMTMGYLESILSKLIMAFPGDDIEEIKMILNNSAVTLISKDELKRTNKEETNDGNLL